MSDDNTKWVPPVERQLNIKPCSEWKDEPVDPATKFGELSAQVSVPVTRDDRPSIAELQRMRAGMATDVRPWYPRSRFISLVPDNTGMGANLHTNHIANFVDQDDATGVCALVNASLVLLEIAAAALAYTSSDGTIGALFDAVEKVRK